MENLVELRELICMKKMYTEQRDRSEEKILKQRYSIFHNEIIQFINKEFVC